MAKQNTSRRRRGKDFAHPPPTFVYGSPLKIILEIFGFLSPRFSYEGELVELAINDYGESLL